MSFFDRLHEIRDPNFTGFKKRKKGAYQWKKFNVKEGVLDKPSWHVVASYVAGDHAVLDIGCGDGAHACALSKRCRRVWGVDADWEGIRLARRMKSERRVKKAVFLHAPLSRLPRKLPHKKRTFNVVYSLDVIEHLPDPEELLKVSSQMVAPKGLVIIGTPLFVREELVSRHHVKEYTIDEMRRMMSAHFDIVKEHTLPLKRKDGKVYENGFYISVAAPKPANGDAPVSERSPFLVEIYRKVLRCAVERRMPYGYYRFKHFLRTCVKFVLNGIRRLVPYWWEYFFSRAGYAIFLHRSYAARAASHDLVFILKRKTPGWILEGVCEEIARYFPGRTRFHYAESRSPWPPARAYFFGHYSYLPGCLRSHASLWGSKLLVFYTHPKILEPHTLKHHVYALNQCAKVLCMNSESVRLLRGQGVRPDRLTALIGGADPRLFRPHERNGGAVGFSTAYYPRKCPDLILEIVKAMPHRRFVLLGPQGEDPNIRHRKWQRYPRFGELVSQPNFQYVEAPYAEYPRHYEKIDVFVSVSKLEGGPIPLIETMMCNAVPVVSKTGFAPDIIRHGENGFLFEVGSPVAEICGLIEKAYEFQADIRSAAVHLSWENYSRQIQRLLGETEGC